MSLKKLMSRDMRFPPMWYVWPARPQISLCILTVWSEPLLVAWIFYEFKATEWTSFGVSKLKRRLHILVWVYTFQNATLLEIRCLGSNFVWDINSRLEHDLPTSVRGRLISPITRVLFLQNFASVKFCENKTLAIFFWIYSTREM